GTSLSITGLSPNTSYAMTVTAGDAAGNWSAPSTVLNAATLADTTAPSVPAGLNVTGATVNSFTLNWTASTDNVGVTSYRVYKAGVLYNTTSGTSLAITGLTPNTSYAMTVSAGDAAGNWSAPSTVLNVSTVADTTAPSVPVGLNATGATLNSFTLNWTAATDNVGVTSYRVYKAGVLYNTTSGTSLAITGLTPNTSYAMTVSAGDAAGNWSAPSTVLNVSTVADTTAPSVPVGLNATGATLNSFTLNWTAATDNVGVTSYRVYKAGVLYNTTSGTSLAISGLAVKTSYAMTVSAGDAAGNWSAPSTVLNVSTVADTTAPSVPVGLNATGATINSFTLNWTAATDNVGVTSY